MNSHQKLSFRDKSLHSRRTGDSLQWQVFSISFIQQLNIISQAWFVWPEEMAFVGKSSFLSEERIIFRSLAAQLSINWYLLNRVGWLVFTGKEASVIQETKWYQLEKHYSYFINDLFLFLFIQRDRMVISSEYLKYLWSLLWHKAR